MRVETLSSDIGGSPNIEVAGLSDGAGAKLFSVLVIVRDTLGLNGRDSGNTEEGHVEASPARSENKTAPAKEPTGKASRALHTEKLRQLGGLFQPLATTEANDVL